MEGLQVFFILLVEGLRTKKVYKFFHSFKIIHILDIPMLLAAPIFCSIFCPVSRGQGLVQTAKESNSYSRGLNEVKIDDGQISEDEGLLILP